MRKGEKKDVFSKLLISLKKILEKTPSLEKMREDVKEMGLYMRSVEGNPMIIKKIKEEKIIEVLWKLGKIDMLLERNFHLLNKKQQQFIFNSFENIKEQLITDLNPYFTGEIKDDGSSYLLLEVTRRRNTDKDIN